MSVHPFFVRISAHARGVVVATTALLVVVGLLATGLHHHEDGASHHGCAICVAAHATAEGTPHVAPSAPAGPRAEQVTEARASRPCAAPRRATAPRGPPAA